MGGRASLPVLEPDGLAITPERLAAMGEEERETETATSRTQVECL
jgi:hypothetical protein